MLIKGFIDLCAEVGSAWETEASVAKRLYKDTACGISFLADDEGIELAGYAEGANVECPVHRLDYPFTSEKFWAEVEAADQEGCDMWEEWNCA